MEQILAVDQFIGAESAKIVSKLGCYSAHWECAQCIGIHHIGSLGPEVFACNRFWPCTNSKVLNRQICLQSLEVM